MPSCHLSTCISQAGEVARGQPESQTLVSIRFLSPGWLCRSHEFRLGTFSRSQGWEYGSENQLRNAGKAWLNDISCLHIMSTVLRNCNAYHVFYRYITRRQKSKNLGRFYREAIRALPWLQWGWWRAIVVCLIWTADVVSVASESRCYRVVC